VIGETEIVDGTVRVNVYFKNEGDEFAPANCTFAVKYDPNLIEFDKLTNIENSPWSNNSAKGYVGSEYSAPLPNATNPLSDVRTVEIDYDNYTRKAGVLVPYTKALVGTLVFKIRQANATYNFDWYKSTAIYRTNGDEITGFGTFDPIDPVSTVRRLTITSPNGGEVWKSGKSYNISWVAPSQDANVLAELSTDKGNTWTRISDVAVLSSTANMEWIATKVNSTECLVRLVGTDGTEYDRSNNVFTIVPPIAQITRPATTDPVYVGGKKDVIRWSVEDVKTVKFEFSEDGTNNWKPVTATVNSANGQVEWVVPMVNTKQAVIVMKDVATNSTLAVSEPFKVLIGQVTFISPTAGEALKVNTTKPVRWTSSSVSNFDLQLSMDNGATWNFIDKNTSAAKAMYSWLVPNQNSDNAIIRAIYTNDPELEYARTAAFRITGFVPTEEENLVFTVDEPTPNPFSTTTSIKFNLPKASTVYATVFNAAGVKVAELGNGATFPAGENTVKFESGVLASGVYYIRITAGGNTLVREAVLTK